MSESPDEILMKIISSKIEQSNIIPEETLKRYSKAIGSGNMTPEDWGLLAESSDKDMQER